MFCEEIITSHFLRCYVEPERYSKGKLESLSCNYYFFLSVSPVTADLSVWWYKRDARALTRKITAKNKLKVLFSHRLQWSVWSNLHRDYLPKFTMGSLLWFSFSYFHLRESKTLKAENESYLSKRNKNCFFFFLYMCVCVLLSIHSNQSTCTFEQELILPKTSYYIKDYPGYALIGLPQSGFCNIISIPKMILFHVFFFSFSCVCVF